MARSQPFSFSNFHGPAEASKAINAPAYSQEDLDASVSAAREAAISSIVANEARKQTALLETIAERLSDAADAQFEGMADYLDSLSDAAEEIVTQYCLAASTAQQNETALNLLERHLKAAGKTASAALVMSDKTIKAARTKLAKAIAQKGAQEIVIETDAALSPGELRLEWRGGAIASDHAVLASEIKSIFAVKRARRAHATQKKEAVL